MLCHCKPVYRNLESVSTDTARHTAKMTATKGRTGRPGCSFCGLRQCLLFIPCQVNPIKINKPQPPSIINIFLSPVTHRPIQIGRPAEDTLFFGTQKKRIPRQNIFIAHESGQRFVVIVVERLRIHTGTTKTLCLAACRSKTKGTTWPKVWNRDPRP